MQQALFSFFGRIVPSERTIRGNLIRYETRVPQFEDSFQEMPLNQ